MNNMRTKVAEVGEVGALKEKLANIQKGWSGAVAKSKKTSKQIYSYAQKNPWTFGLIALGIGLATGYMLSGDDEE